MIVDEVSEVDPKPLIAEEWELDPIPLTVVEWELDSIPLTVVELELFAVVGIAPAAVVVGTDVSTAGIETGWPTPEHKDSTRLDTAIGPS